jgi:hypothetical protein
MRYSALWSPFFFVGLLLACARIEAFPERALNPGAEGAHPTRKTEVIHSVKVALETPDSLALRERTFAEGENPAPGGAQ